MVDNATIEIITTTGSNVLSRVKLSLTSQIFNAKALEKEKQITA